MPDELEDLHDEGRDKVGDVEDSAGEVGKGYQEVDQAKDDYKDDDQDARAGGEDAGGAERGQRASSEDAHACRLPRGWDHRFATTLGPSRGP